MEGCEVNRFLFRLNSSDGAKRFLYSTKDRHQAFFVNVKSESVVQSLKVAVNHYLPISRVGSQFRRKSVQLRFNLKDLPGSQNKTLNRLRRPFILCTVKVQHQTTVVISKHAVLPRCVVKVSDAPVSEHGSQKK